MKSSDIYVGQVDIVHEVTHVTHCMMLNDTYDGQGASVSEAE